MPAERFARWVGNFESGHGGALLAVSEGALRGTAADGSWFEARLPFDRGYEGEARSAAFADAAAPPADWGVLLARKGGFALARLSGPEVVGSKVGRRHVQGRTKAGGQSQQRFARRRANQAREAYEAAAEHAGRLLAGVAVLVVGGDRTAIAAVFAAPGIAALQSAVVDPFLGDLPEPRRAELDAAIQRASSIRVQVRNA